MYTTWWIRRWAYTHDETTTTSYSLNIPITSKSFLPPSFNPINLWTKYLIIYPQLRWGREEEMQTMRGTVYFRCLVGLSKWVKGLVRSYVRYNFRYIVEWSKWVKVLAGNQRAICGKRATQIHRWKSRKNPLETSKQRRPVVMSKYI